MGPYIPSGSARTKYALVCVDGFSKYVIIQPIRDATAGHIADKLEKHVFSVFGAPSTIVTDNATSFRSNVIEDLCAKWKVNHSFLSPYHPQTNLSERVNRILKPIIRSYLNESNHNRWADNLHLFQLAINSAVHDSSGFSPYRILF